MGIPGLQTYMEKEDKNPICFLVEILELAKKTKRSPTIIVDLDSWLVPMTSPHFMWGGGELKVFFEQVEKFVRKFNDAGITLVFVKDGFIPEGKGETVVKRANQVHSECTIPLFDALIEGKLPENYYTTDSHSYTERLLELYLDCEVITACDIEADEEIVRLAKERNAMAILAQDSDYVIFDMEGIIYLSVRNFDIEDMTTITYDQVALAKNLGLHVNQLPVFAILKGNDLFTYDMMKEFHKHLVRRQPWRKGVSLSQKVIPEIPEFMRRLKVPSTYEEIMECLPRLMMSVFGHTQHLGMAKESVKSYFLKTEMPQVADLDTWNTTILSVKPLSRRAYDVMNFNKLEITSSGQDSRDNRVPPTAYLFKNLRRRMYGVLLHDKPGALSGDKFTVNIEETSLNHASGKMETNEASPIVPPQGSHPGLDQLLDDDYPNVSNLRQRLFFHILAPSVDIEQVTSMSDHEELLYPIAVLSSLLHDHKRPLLEDWELDVFIAQVRNTLAVCFDDLYIYKFEI